MINAANSNVGVMAAMLLAVASLVAFLCRECRQRGDVLLPTEMWARLLCGIRRCRAESDMGNPPLACGAAANKVFIRVNQDCRCQWWMRNRQ